MSRKRIGILGAGPAAAVTAALLKQAGHEVEVIGLPRRDDAVEGLSWRLLDGLEKAGFAELGEVLGKDPAALWPALFGDLPFIRRRLGPRPRFAPAVEVRGIRPVLRGARVSSNHLRVGDACYSGDPLSGHGIFEAASSAWAALPVINTLFERPAAAALAITYYDRRARSIFASRMAVAAEFYGAESRWSDEPFWQRRAVPLSRLIDDRTARAPSPERRFVLEPVVEDGFVVERRVAVIPGAPRGVRFIDGIDLALLCDEISRAGARPGLDTLSARLGAPREPLAKAWRWLLAQGVTGHPVAG